MTTCNVCSKYVGHGSEKGGTICSECLSAASGCSFSTGNEALSVLVRQCIVTNAVDTFLLGGVEVAMDFVMDKWRIPHKDWERYLFRDTDQICVGWKCWKDETELLMIHSECIITVK